MAAWGRGPKKKLRDRLTLDKKLGPMPRGSNRRRVSGQGEQPAFAGGRRGPSQLAQRLANDPLVKAGGKVLGTRTAKTGPRAGSLYAEIEKGGTRYNVHEIDGERRVFRVSGAPTGMTAAQRARKKFRGR
jgi:hypothetical protein